MSRRSGRALIVFFVAPLIPWIAAAGPTGEKPDAAAIAKWIELLGDDDFDKREEASQKLEAAGEAALAALHDAAESHRDTEVRSRAKKIAHAVELALWPEVRNFVGGNPNYWWNRVAFTADGKQALVTGGGVFLYDLGTGKQVYGGVMEVQYARRGLCLSRRTAASS